MRIKSDAKAKFYQVGLPLESIPEKLCEISMVGKWSIDKQDSQLTKSANTYLGQYHPNPAVTIY